MADQIPVAAERACYLSVHRKPERSVHRRNGAHAARTHGAPLPVFPGKAGRQLIRQFGRLLTDVLKRNTMLKGKTGCCLSCKQHHFFNHCSGFSLDDRLNLHPFYAVLLLQCNRYFGKIDGYGTRILPSDAVFLRYGKKRC